MSSDSPRDPKAHDSGGVPQSAPKPPRRSNLQSISGLVISPRWARPGWLLLLLLAVAEVVALWVRMGRVPAADDFVRAADTVRREHKPRDAVTVAPDWADPVLRLYLGDLMPPSVVGRFDLAAFDRLWVVSMRGARAPEAPLRAPDFRAEFGRLSLARYDFAPTPVTADLVALLPQASVELERAGSFRACPYREDPVSRFHGGLGQGPAVPRARFTCDPRRPEAWVGATLFEDLSLRPRYCVHQRPVGDEALATVFRDVPLGEELVVYTALDYHQERDESGAPVTLRVLVDGREVGRVVHRDGDGALRASFPTRIGPDAQRRGEIRLEVRSEDPARRVFCWAATTRDARREETP
jgi:hypothetical protein